MNAMTPYHDLLEDAELRALHRTLEREAQASIEANARGTGGRAKTFLVCDFEYLFRCDAFNGWCRVREPERDRHGRPIVRKVHWPFHSIAAASWMTMRFFPGEDMPEIEPPVVMTMEDGDEADIVEAFFAALDAIGHHCRMVTWGGEARDHSVLRHAACRHGLVLPVHLRDTAPFARERLDLCRATVTQADPVHLDEYAAASGIPAKPSPATEVGKLAEAERWDEVADHCLGDVLTTSVVALRWLSAMGEVVCERGASTMAIAAAATAAYPDSPFLIRTFRPWARGQRSAAGLRGKVYRAPVTT